MRSASTNGMIDLPALASAIGADYFLLRRWVLSGLVQVSIRRSSVAEYKHIRLTIDGAIELVTILRLRAQGVPLQRIRKAIERLRSANIKGACWLALTGAATDVLIRTPDKLTSILTGRTYVTAVLDVRAVRAEVRNVMAQREVTA